MQRFRFKALEVELNGDIYALSRYLGQHGVANRVTRERHSWVLWVMDEEAVKPVQKLFLAVQKKQIDLGQYASQMTAEAMGHHGALFHRIEGVIKQLFGCPLTWFFILICVSVFFYTNGGLRYVEGFLFSSKTGSYIDQFGLVKGLPLQEFWRFVTPVFLHFGWSHFIFNVCLFFIFSYRLERAIGLKQFLILVLALSVMTNLSQYLAAGPDFGGLSGIIYGLSGLCWMLDWRFQSDYFPIQNKLFWVMLLWLVVGIFQLPMLLGLFGDMANTSHLIGLMIGLTAAFLVKIKASYDQFSY